MKFRFKVKRPRIGMKWTVLSKGIVGAVVMACAPTGNERQGSVDEFLFGLGYSECTEITSFGECGWSGFEALTVNLNSCILKSDTLILLGKEEADTIFTDSWKVLDLEQVNLLDGTEEIVVVCYLYPKRPQTGLAASYSKVILLKEDVSIGGMLETCHNDRSVYSRSDSMYLILYDFDYEYRGVSSCCRAMNFQLLNLQDFTLKPFNRVLLDGCKDGKSYLIDKDARSLEEHIHQVEKMGCK